MQEAAPAKLDASQLPNLAQVLLCADMWKRRTVLHCDCESGFSFHQYTLTRIQLQVLLCADMWKRRDVLHAAYCDREGVTEAFIKNGLRHAFCSVGCSVAADPANWDYEVQFSESSRQCHGLARLCCVNGCEEPAARLCNSAALQQCCCRATCG